MVARAVPTLSAAIEERKPVLRKLVRLFDSYFPNVGYVASRRWFEHISTYESGRHLLFMNYGLAVDPSLPLRPEDEDHRYPIQLYHRVASAVSLSGKDLLEVGCGRGGGASYVMRCLKPASMVGLDLASNAIAFCNQYYNIPQLSFCCGDAQDLPFPDRSFDALLNVESSVCYPDPARFFAEVERVLRPGGHFLYADLREREQLHDWQSQLTALNLERLAEEELTASVLSALDLDDERKRRLIARYVPRGLRFIFSEFAGLRDSRFFYGALQRGEKVYKRFVFQKAA